MLALKRCAWVTVDPIYQDYHDQEWGRPLWNDRLLFEFLNLEGAQAGLSWLTILKKRLNYRLAFDNFDAEKMARYDVTKYHQLITNPGIIRNKLKVAAFIKNAQAYMRLRDEGINFVDYIWQFVDGQPITNHWASAPEVPITTPQSDAMAKSLKERGFTFVGSTICYAYMQAVGMVNDHLTTCFCFDAIASLDSTRHSRSI